MPRKTKETNELQTKELTENTKKTTKTESKSKSTKSSAKKASTKAKTTSAKSKASAKTSKATSSKAKSTSKKKATKTTAKKTTTTKKKTTSTRNTKRKKTDKKPEILEYYDLPYRYNQTVVKLLAQTPTTLFVYWDISDKDKENFIATFGEYFFNNTKPVLIIDNETMNYRYEIDINDFANSWYLHLPDSNCHYRVELGRRPINHYVSIPNDYLPISSSNEMITPNDHILFESIGQTVTFKNIKTNQIQVTSISSIVPAVYKNDYKLPIQKLFAMFYKKEDFPFTARFSFTNPSSGNPTSTFK